MITADAPGGLGIQRLDREGARASLDQGNVPDREPGEVVQLRNRWY